MENSSSFENPFSGETHGEFTWCLHCECVYKTESWVENEWDCPDMSCDGGIMDASTWDPEQWPMDNNPE